MPSGKSARNLRKYRKVKTIVASALNLAEKHYSLRLYGSILGAISQIQLESIKENSCERFRYLTFKAIGHEYSGNLVEAEEICSNGLIEYPDALDFYYLLTNLKSSMREFSRAIEYGQKYLQILRYKPILEGMPFPLCAGKPHLSKLQNTLGDACRQQNKVESAILHYEAAITADSGNHLPHLNLATLHYHLKDIERTQNAVERGLSNCTQVQELQILKKSLKNKQTVSACIVVQDEEKLLPGCLDSLRNWVDEIVIVDTGSNDKTVSIAMSYGAKVFNQQWDGNFSKHRNFSIEMGTSDWIFIIDADERIYDLDVPDLKELINSDQNDIISVNIFDIINRDEKAASFSPAVRLFKRDLNLRFEGMVHNYLALPEIAKVTRSRAKIRHLACENTSERRRRKFERSHAFLEKQLRQNPNDILTLFNMTQLLCGAGKDKPDFFSNDIIRYASKTVSLTNSNDVVTKNIRVMSLDHLAWAHYYKGNHKQALSYAEMALNLKKNYPSPLLLLGHLYVQFNQHEKAKAAYKHYLDVEAKYDPISETDVIILSNPDSRAAAYFGLGLISEQTGNIKEAREFYRKSSQINPEHADLKQKVALFANSPEHGYSSIGAGSKLLQQGKFEEAESSFHEAVKDASDKRSTIEEIGSFYVGKGMYKDAIKFYQLWLDTNPYDAGFLNALADCYFNMRQFEQAQKYYESASELANAPITVYRNLGLTCTHLNQVGKAILAFRKYLDSRPKDREIEFVMADLCMKMGDFKSAMSLYESLLRTIPGDYQSIFKLSDCYLNLGQEDSARIGYFRVLELNPEFEPAKKRLSQLEKVSEVIS